MSNEGPGNVHAFPGAPPPGGGNGKTLGERVAAIEAHMQHAATKADLTKMESTLVKWMLGTLGGTTLVALGSLVVHVLLK